MPPTQATFRQAPRAKADDDTIQPELGLEYGLWQGAWDRTERLWLRFWDEHGELLPTSDEAAAVAQRQAAEAQRKAAEAQRQADLAEQEKRRLADKLRELGIDPDQLR